MPTPARPSSCRAEPHAGLSIQLAGAGGPTIFRCSGSVLVGRGETCDLRLDDRRVSRRHAEIYRLGSLWWVRDLDSTGGTYLDGEDIDAAPVAPGAALQLGAGGPTIWLEPAAESRMAA